MAQHILKIEWRDCDADAQSGGTKLVLSLDGHTEEFHYSHDRLEEALAKAKSFLEATRPIFANVKPAPPAV
jgi:hypothetical protein